MQLQWLLPKRLLHLGWFLAGFTGGRTQGDPPRVRGARGDVPLHGHGRRQTINKRPNVCNEIYAAAFAIELYIGFEFRTGVLLFRSWRGSGQKEKASTSTSAALPFWMLGGLSKIDATGFGVEGFLGRCSCTLLAVDPIRRYVLRKVRHPTDWAQELP